MSSTLEFDQDDMTARLVADSVTGLVTVFSQRKGITENDIQTNLGALNQKSGLTGMCLIVLMPVLIPSESNTPSAMYATRYSVQVIDWPVVRRIPTGGIQITAESMAERVRQILHFASFGRGQSMYFDGMTPVAMKDEKQISYLVSFKKLGADTAVPKVAICSLSPNYGQVPQTVTVACATPGSTIYYTTDGSYPSSVNPTALVYTAPLNITVQTALRVAAEAPGYQQNDPSPGAYTAIAHTSFSSAYSDAFN